MKEGTSKEGKWKDTTTEKEIDFLLRVMIMWGTHVMIEKDADKLRGATLQLIHCANTSKMHPTTTTTTYFLYSKPSQQHHLRFLSFSFSTVLTPTPPTCTTNNQDPPICLTQLSKLKTPATFFRKLKHHLFKLKKHCQIWNGCFPDRLRRFVKVSDNMNVRIESVKTSRERFEFAIGQKVKGKHRPTDNWVGPKSFCSNRIWVAICQVEIGKVIECLSGVVWWW